MPLKTDSGFITHLLAFLAALFGAVTSYLYKLSEGEAFSWRTLCIQTIISLFAGFLATLWAESEGFEQKSIGALSGMAGWLGALLIKEIERRIIGAIRK